ncbi:MAG: lipopolysaccharide heptosyltransferase II [Ktedonobacteraceae bacterium]|nr:lipopolysaccharide heptosyltransferase II [Ktedonobacteraceae bacterium]
MQTLPMHNRDEYGYPLHPDSRRKLRATLVQTSKRILLGAIYLLLALLGCGLSAKRLWRRPAPLSTRTFHPRRILVIRLDLIGDLVMSLPVVRTLKRTYPDAQIDLLATPGSASILAGADPDLREVITYDPNIWRRPTALLRPRNWREARALRQRLRANHYDLAVSVFGPWAAILAVLSGAPRRVGYGAEGYPGFMTDSAPGRHWQPGEHLHEIDYDLLLASMAGATIQPEDRSLRLYVSTQAQQEIEALLLQEGFRPDRPLIACHVTSNNGQSKRWPIPYWSTLIDRLIQEDDANIVLTGAPVDLSIIKAVLDRVQARSSSPINMAGKTSLAQLAALLQRTNLLITGDSGPMHIAAAVGTALIAIHGPTDPAHSGPISPQATVLRSDIWCSPCYHAQGPADCRFFTTQCMKNITPDQVLRVARQKVPLEAHE